MYIIKQQPEDFIVKEINSRLKPEKHGDFSYFLLKKRDYTTERAVQKIADIFRIKRKYINYAGNKDKKAVTSQYISINKLSPYFNKNCTLKDIELTFLGNGNEIIYLGFLDYNGFEIIVRNLNSDYKLNKGKQIPNYFDQQRFSKSNPEVGKYIIKGNFKKAAETLMQSGTDYEAVLAEFLKDSPNNYIGAMRTIPKKILTLFVGSYQSLLFNQTIEEYIKLKRPKANIKIPIIGFGTSVSDKTINAIITNILKRENVTLREFIIKSIPELSSEGDERDLFLTLKNLKISKMEDDELNNGKKKVRVTFRLGKGSYATIVIKSLFSAL